jgi:uncharacterized protein YprB with RNaseH-like and TPR domain
VPHRLEQQRERRLYLDVSNAPVWMEIQADRLCNYKGKAFDPPFVVVRRTSSPSDRKRARATIVRNSGPVLVENHLLVLLPRVRTLAECRRIMQVLRDDRTDEWLNSTLRCRHLTVGAVKQIPIWD